MLLAATLIATLLVGNGLYYCVGALRKMGAITATEMNESEMFVTKHGELEEIFPEELVTKQEVKVVNVASRIAFLFIAVWVWIIMGLTVGRVASMMRPGDLWKLIVYFLIYLLLLRIPFGIVNRSIERSFEVKLMPDKLGIAIVAIVGYIIGLNYYAYLPDFITFHLRLLE